MTNSALTYNNGTISYQVSGSGEPIVFIHGFSLDHRMWRPQVKFFEKNHTVITYDVRGFGQSSLPTQTYNHSDDLYTLLKHLGITSAHIVGLSMGGRIATNFTLAYPDMVRSLTLMDSALDGYASTVNWNVHAKKVGIAAAKENWLNHDVFAETRNNPAVIAAIRPIIDDYSGWHWLHSDLEHPKNTHARTRLNEITVPTLIIVGEKDLSYFHDIATVYADGIKNSRKVIVPNVGHMVNMEAPDVVNELLADFIGGDLE